MGLLGSAAASAERGCIDGRGNTLAADIDRRGPLAATTPARAIALACANSPILKTAIAGEDPNWGRVVMAVGKAGEAASRDRLAIWFGPHCVAREGERAQEYVEATVAGYMKQREISIRIDVGVSKPTSDKKSIRWTQLIRIRF